MSASRLMRAVRSFFILLVVLLCLIVGPRVSAQIVTASAEKEPGGANRWAGSILAFEVGDKINPPPKKAVVFVGSSTVRFWKTLQADFPEVPVINRGFGGSEVCDAVKYADRIVIPYDPRVVVIYAGGNDLFFNNTPAEVLEQYKLLDDELRQALSDVMIIHVTLSPTIRRLYQEPLVRELNALLADYVKGQPKMFLVDTYSKLIGADGQPQTKFLRGDGLHPSAAGYQVMTDELKPVLLKAYTDAGGTLNAVPAGE